MKALLKTAEKYDDILYIYLRFDNVDLVTTYSFRKQALICIKHLVKSCLLAFQGLFKTSELKSKLTHKNWFYIIHTNNYDSVVPVLKKTKNTALVSNHQVINNPDLVQLKFYRQLFYLWKFPFIFYHLYRKHGKRCFRAFHLIFTSIGMYETAVCYLKRYQPTLVVFANDHSPVPRALLLATKARGIKSVYIPHANASIYFPPLSFTLSLLDGENMQTIYAQCGPIESQVELIGSLKTDPFLHLKNTASQVRRIGVCTNMFDEVERVHALITRLHHQFPEVIVTFRSHPSDKRDFGILPQKVIISNAKEEPTLDFLLKQDMLIAGDSSIHLEAAYMNIASCYFKFTDSDFLDDDYYGFVKSGLIPRANNLEILIQLIEQKLKDKGTINPVVKKYNSAIGTSFEGKSAEKAAALIEDLLKSV